MRTRPEAEKQAAKRSRGERMIFVVFSKDEDDLIGNDYHTATHAELSTWFAGCPVLSAWFNGKPEEVYA